MYLFKRAKLALFAVAAVLLVTACNKANDTEKVTANHQSEQSKIIDLTVFKHPSCGCCQDWIDHMESQGFSTKATNTEQLGSIKQEHGIAPNHSSCHTAVSPQGYVFEGHVPAKFVKQFLKEAPQDAIGLAVPAMPVGSPGMEMGDQFMPYKVLLLKTDGSVEVFADIQNYQEQF